MIHAQNAKLDLLLAPDTASATAVRTANIDTLGVDYASIIVNLSSEKNTDATGVAISLLEADDTEATSFATFNSSFQSTIDLATAKDVLYHVDTRSRKRYLRLSLTPDTTTNGNISASASALLTRQGEAPASTTDMGATIVVIG